MKEDFPILNREINGNKLVYLDNAATSQKPKQVIDSLNHFYMNHNANIHRGLHTLSEEATEMYGLARKKTASFIGAHSPEEVVFTRGATDSLNMVAFAFAQNVLKPGDVILLTESEHHSNLIPWQIVAEKTGAVLEFLSINNEGLLDEKEILDKANSGKVRIVSLAHSSNLLGTIFPVKRIADIFSAKGAYVVIDGAQAAPHLPINVQSLGCDFYAFSGHKMLGPMGIGVLWGKKELLKQMNPFEYGGGMIDVVGFTSATYAEIPEKFEAGTPNAAGAVGLSSAIDYLNNVSMQKIREHEISLNSYALKELQKIEDLDILGTKDANLRTGLVSFTVKGIHPHDIAAVLNSHGIAVRSGHHCCMPYHKKLNIPATVRASWYLYNTEEDISVLVKGILKAQEILR